MAGIGFALQRLAREDNLLGPLKAFVHSAVVAAGPWLITIVALSIVIFARGGDAPELSVFRLVTMYNFAFSLVLVSPICAIVTRYIADSIYHEHFDRIPGTLVGGLICMIGVLAPLGAWFYGYYLDISPLQRYLGFCGFMLIGSVWLVSIFLSAIRDYTTISQAFFAGFAVPVLAALLPLFPSTDRGTMLLCAMSLGLALTVSILIFRVLSAFRAPVRAPFEFLTYVRRYWELPVGALAFNLGAWIDKWIMWTSPEHALHPEGFVSFPGYDNAMFLAHLSVVPVLSIFVYAIETMIYDSCKRYHLAISGHASLVKICEHQKAIISVAFLSARNVLVIQGSFSLLLIFLAPHIFASAGLPFLEVGIFRFGVIGSMFLTFLLFVNVFFSYLDARRYTLITQGLFLALNAICTAATLSFGFRFYGYGFTIAAMVACVAGIALLGGLLAQLPYHTFVRNNSSVMRAD